MFLYAKDILKRINASEIPAASDVDAKVSDYIRYAKDRLNRKAAKENF